MRIIAGRFKGRKLTEFKAEHIRPTTDRVKETLFNIVQFDVPEAHILDLFSGTGNLAIEAISRGAKKVVAVEKHKLSLKIIRENLGKLGIEKEVQVVPKDVFQFVKSYKGEPFQVIFIDPPFTEAIAHECMNALKDSEVAQENTIVIIESSRHERIDDDYGAFHLLDRREFGDKSASFFKKAKI